MTVCRQVGRERCEKRVKKGRPILSSLKSVPLGIDLF